MPYTVVSAVDSELQSWVKDTKEEAARLVRTLNEENEGQPDILVFPCEPLKLSIKTSIELD